ncbi:MAG: hypothetical protein IJL87_08735 [Clostridia bacterium]|nr:hypothetical protein [Clostridia bacterium]
MKISVREDCRRAALSLGSFIGWNFTVIELARQSLSASYAITLFPRVKMLFLASQLFFLLLTIVLMTIFDVEGIICRPIMRVIPAVFMGEGAIAMAMCRYSTASAFAVVAGFGAATGAVAMLTALLKLRTRDRLKVIGVSLPAAALIFILGGLAAPAVLQSETSRITVGAILAAAVVLSIRFEKFSGSSTGIINHFDEKTAAYVLKKLPWELFAFFPLCTGYFICLELSGGFAQENAVEDFDYLRLGGFIIFALAAVTVGFLAKPHNAGALFAAGSIVTAAGVLVLSVSTLTMFEKGMYTFFAYIGFALFMCSVYLIISGLATSRLHPLFYATSAFFVYILSQLTASFVTNHIHASREKSVYIAAVLGVVGLIALPVISKGLAQKGYTAQAIERRRSIRREIAAMAEEYDLSGRDSIILELLAVERCPKDELRYNMFLSPEKIEKHFKKIENHSGRTVEDIVAELWEKYDDVKA